MMITPNTVRLTETEATEAVGLAAEVGSFYVLLGAAGLRADVMDRERLRALFPGVVSKPGTRAGAGPGAGGDSGPVILGAGETVLVASDAYLRLRGGVLAGGLGNKVVPTRVGVNRPAKVLV